MAVGIESGIHVFFALLSLISSGIAVGMLMKGGNNVNMIKLLSLLTAILIWLSWITVAPVYVNEYGVDKAQIKAYPETKPAHSIGMETKEHIFYTGLLLATLLPIVAYSIDLRDEKARKTLLLMFTLLILGGIILDVMGGWISISAKLAWFKAAGGG